MQFSFSVVMSRGPWSGGLCLILELFAIALQRWRRRWFVLQVGQFQGQYVLNYYTDESLRKLKGTICLDECEQVRSPCGYCFGHDRIVMGKSSFFFAFHPGWCWTHCGKRQTKIRAHVWHQNPATNFLLGGGYLRRNEQLGQDRLWSVRLKSHSRRWEQR